MTVQTQFFCDVCRRPGVRFDIPVGEAPEGGRPPVEALDLCQLCLAHQVKAFLALMPYEERTDWIARVRSAQGATRHG